MVPAGLFYHSCFNLCSLFNRQTNLAKTVREDWKEFKMHRKGKDIRKKRDI
jgi:hypothetical protein